MFAVYSKETNWRRKSKPQKITTGFTRSWLKKALCPLLFFTMPVTSSKATEMLLTALKANIRLTKKAR
jgi:hypothetical protein